MSGTSGSQGRHGSVRDGGGAWSPRPSGDVSTHRPGQASRSHRAAIVACIAVAALAAVGLVTAFVLGVGGHDPTSGPPSPHAAHGQVTSGQ
jgi:hypothetical protein